MGIKGMREERNGFGQSKRDILQRWQRFLGRWWWPACLLLIPMVTAAVITRVDPVFLPAVGAASASLGLVLLCCAVSEIHASNSLHLRQIEETRALRLAVISGAAQVDLLLDDVAIIARQARKDAADAAARVLILGQSARRGLHTEADEIRRQRSAEKVHGAPAHVPHLGEGEPQDAGPEDPTVVRAVPEVPSSRRIGSVVGEVPRDGQSHDSDEGDTRVWTRTMVSAR